jgi:hypothetical protein
MEVVEEKDEDMEDAPVEPIAKAPTPTPVPVADGDESLTEPDFGYPVIPPPQPAQPPLDSLPITPAPIAGPSTKKTFLKPPTSPLSDDDDDDDEKVAKPKSKSKKTAAASPPNKKKRGLPALSSDEEDAPKNTVSKVISKPRQPAAKNKRKW